MEGADSSDSPTLRQYLLDRPVPREEGNHSWIYGGKVILFLVIVLSSFAIIWERSMRISEDEWASFLNETFSYYSPPLCIIIMVFFWAGDLGVLHWRGLGVILQEVEESRTYGEVLEIAIWMFASLIASLAEYSFAFSFGYGVPTIPLLVLYVACPFILVRSNNLCKTSARDLWHRFVHIAHLDFTPADILLVDIFTSLAKVFSDLACSIGRMVFGGVEVCSTYWIPATVVLALPFFCRLMQCIRRYRMPTGERTDLVNALKFFIAILANCFSVASSKGTWFYTIWIVLCVIYSTFAFYWDIYQDWNLQVHKWIFRRMPNLRTRILHGHLQWGFYYLLISEMILRYSWTLKLLDYDWPTGILGFLLAFLEMVRRFQWILFRLEHVYNNQDYQDTEAGRADHHEEALEEPSTTVKDNIVNNMKDPSTTVKDNIVNNMKDPGSTSSIMNQPIKEDLMNQTPSPSSEPEVQNRADKLNLATKVDQVSSSSSPVQDLAGKFPATDADHHQEGQGPSVKPTEKGNVSNNVKDPVAVDSDSTFISNQ